MGFPSRLAIPFYIMARHAWEPGSLGAPPNENDSHFNCARGGRFSHCNYYTRDRLALST